MHEAMPFVAARIVSIQHDGDGIGWVELEGENIALGARAGQFAMIVRPGDASGDARPFAYFHAAGAHRARFLMRERTQQPASLLRAARQSTVLMRGPLGRPFDVAAHPVWAVAGGIGASAFGLLRAGSAAQKLQLFLGIKAQSDYGIVDALRAHFAEAAHDVTLHIVCDEAAKPGIKTVLDLLETTLSDALRGQISPPAMLLGCGPQGMLARVAALSYAHHIACELSLGIPLPCGVGSCGLCAHTDRSGRSRLACVDGPTYPAHIIF